MKCPLEDRHRYFIGTGMRLEHTAVYVISHLMVGSEGIAGP